MSGNDSKIAEKLDTGKDVAEDALGVTLPSRISEIIVATQNATITSKAWKHWLEWLNLLISVGILMTAILLIYNLIEIDKDTVLNLIYTRLIKNRYGKEPESQITEGYSDNPSKEHDASLFDTVRFVGILGGFMSIILVLIPEFGKNSNEEDDDEDDEVEVEAEAALKNEKIEPLTLDFKETESLDDLVDALSLAPDQKSLPKTARENVPTPSAGATLHPSTDNNDIAENISIISTKSANQTLSKISGQSYTELELQILDQDAKRKRFFVVLNWSFPIFTVLFMIATIFCQWTLMHQNLYLSPMVNLGFINDWVDLDGWKNSTDQSLASISKDMNNSFAFNAECDLEFGVAACYRFDKSDVEEYAKKVSACKTNCALQAIELYGECCGLGAYFHEENFYNFDEDEVGLVTQGRSSETEMEAEEGEEENPLEDQSLEPQEAISNYLKLEIRNKTIARFNQTKRMENRVVLENKDLQISVDRTSNFFKMASMPFRSSSVIRNNHLDDLGRILLQNGTSVPPTRACANNLQFIKNSTEIPSYVPNSINTPYSNKLVSCDVPLRYLGSSSMIIMVGLSLVNVCLQFLLGLVRVIFVKKG